MIDERRLLKNLKIIKRIKDNSGAKVVLALKCFSAWGVFKLIRQYLDGTTASSPYEARLGYEKFGKEVHVYSVGYAREDIKEVGRFADKIIFNSVSQLKMFSRIVCKPELGLRVNPRVSYSHFDLADPARKFSRLGVIDKKSILNIAHLISGVMFHFNCENDDFGSFASHLDYISHHYGKILNGLKWVSLGGGLYFTKQGYPVEKFCKKLKEFSERFKIQVYLEPGESAITQSAELVTRVLDIVRNKMDIAVVDASVEAHMLDLLVYGTHAKIKNIGPGRFTPLEKGRLDRKRNSLTGFKYMIAGRSCLAGDIFGTYGFRSRLKVGSIIKFADAAGYTMVKKNWFNGLKMPAIAVKRLDRSVELVREFKYKDFVNSLS